MSELTPDEAYGRLKKVETPTGERWYDTKEKRFVSNELGKLVQRRAKSYGNLSQVATLDLGQDPDRIEIETNPKDLRAMGASKSRIRETERKIDKLKLLRAIDTIHIQRNISREEAKEVMQNFLKIRADAIGDFDTPAAMEEFLDERRRIMFAS